MQVSPKTEKEIMEANLWPVGEYSFEIITATEKVSSKSNEMMELKINVFNDNGHSRILFDYLMDTPTMAYKLRHCCEVTGLLEQYEQGTLLERDFDGKTGTLKLNIQKDKTGAYPDKNGVADYITENSAKPLDHQKTKASAYVPEPDMDDEIPF